MNKQIIWDCIVVTSFLNSWRQYIEEELSKLKKAQLLPKHKLLLFVEDPQPSECCKESYFGVGSGGATLNALLIVAERLSAIAGYTNINSDILSNKLILLVHSGKSSYHNIGGNAFFPIPNHISWIPSSVQSPKAPTIIQNSMWMTTLLASKSTNGVWITSLDFFLQTSTKITIPTTTNTEGAIICSIPQLSLRNTRNRPHGTLYLDSSQKLHNAVYAILDNEDKKQTNSLISGTCFLSSALAEKFLSLYMFSPLDRCTYYGTDSATEPIQISLYFDLLLPLLPGTDKEKFISGELSQFYAHNAQFNRVQPNDAIRARRTIWDNLQSFEANKHVLDVEKSYYFDPNLPINSIFPIFEEFRRLGKKCGNVVGINSCIEVDNFSLNSFHSEEFKESLSYKECKNSLDIEDEFEENLNIKDEFKGGLNIESDSDMSEKRRHIYLMNSFIDTGVKLVFKGDCILSDFCFSKNLTHLSENIFNADMQVDENVSAKYNNILQNSNNSCPEDFEFNLGSRMIWQNWVVNLRNFPRYIVTCHGFDDPLTLEMTFKNFKIGNQSWSSVSERLNVFDSDIWDDCANKNLIEARLFCSDLNFLTQIIVLSELFSCDNRYDSNNCVCEFCSDKADLKKCADSDSEKLIHYLSNSRVRDSCSRFYFTVCRKVWLDSDRISFKSILSNTNFTEAFNRRDKNLVYTAKDLICTTALDLKGPNFVALFNYFVTIPFCVDFLLLTFHDVLVKETTSSSRLLANVADLLACLGGTEGGLRSGPAANKAWIQSLDNLKTDYSYGVQKIFELCFKAVKSYRPDFIIRSARHFERACHILISKQMETVNSQVFYFLKFQTQIRKGAWVQAEAPARLDLAGGWTDTPPICYEMGGIVVNLAIKIDGKKPIGAKARIINDLVVKVVMIDIAGNIELVWCDLDQLKDFDNPVSPGALVKSCILYSRFLNLNEGVSLPEQLKNKYKGGLELVSWANVPQGSGLGTSSILAGVLLSVLFTIMGYESPNPGVLIHGVLAIEQMLTTGGGWQDQVGGLIGGVKLGTSNLGTPLKVDFYRISVSAEFLDWISFRLFLIYTGKVRLARNLLQTVIRNWYARNQKITYCFDKLKLLSLTLAKHLINDSYVGLYESITEYRELKKQIATDSEPQKVKELMAENLQTCYAQCLAGAGGGGFIYGIKKERNDCLNIKNKDMIEYKVELDDEGLSVYIDGKIQPNLNSNIPILTEETLSRLFNKL